jgi:hypothetical protein
VELEVMKRPSHCQQAGGRLLGYLLDVSDKRGAPELQSEPLCVGNSGISFKEAV